MHGYQCNTETRGRFLYLNKYRVNRILMRIMKFHEIALGKTLPEIWVMILF